MALTFIVRGTFSEEGQLGKHNLIGLSVSLSVNGERQGRPNTLARVVSRVLTPRRGLV